MRDSDAPTADRAAASPDGALSRIVVAGATYRDCSPAARIALLERLRSDQAVAAFEEHLVLETCHRAQLIGVLREARRAPLAGESGAAAVERVLGVVGGLDSAVIGEEQLLGQVRAALAGAAAAGTVGPILGELFRRALRYGRRVRSHAAPGGDRSLADRAARWITARLGDPAGRSAIVLGTGEIARLLAAKLRDAGMTLTIASRRLERAETAASPFGARAITLEVALAEAAGTAALAIATRSSAPILRTEHVPERALPLVVDLSTPGAVDAAAGERLGDRLLTVDQLAAVEGISTLAPAVERRLRRELIAEAEAFAAWLQARGAERGIGALHRHADAVRRRHLERLASRASLDSEQLAAVEAATAGIVAELLHVPTVQLRGDPDAERRVLDLFGVGS